MSARSLEGLARLLSAASHPRHVVIAAVALIAAVNIARDRRKVRFVVVVLIVLAAAEGLAKASGDRSLARLAAWDKRQYQREERARSRRA